VSIKAFFTDPKLIVGIFSIMSKQVLIFVGKRTKNWAIGLDIACQISKTHGRVVLCDTRKYSGILRPISISRLLNQKKFSKAFNFRIHVLKKPNIFERIGTLRETVVKIKELRNSEKDSDLRRILKCHFASYFGTSEVCIQEISTIRMFLTTYRALSLMKACSRFLGQFNNSIESNYLFNGREIVESCIISEIRKRKLRILLYERASRSDKYEVYKTSPHNNEEWWKKISENKLANFENFYNKSSEIRNYIESKKNGLDPFTSIKWRDFLDGSSTQLTDMPTKFIVFFSVSTSEFSPFPEYNSRTGFHTQFEALRQLKSVAQDTGISLVVRRHPNSIGHDGVDREVELWEEFISDKSVIYFPPSSRADSYLIAERSIAVFTWRSTIGFDTLCRGIPSFALGPAKWALDDRVRAWNRKTIEYVLSNDYQFPDISDLIQQYAEYMVSFGTTFHEFDYVERWGYKIKNKKARRNYAFQRILGMPSGY
jgi:hypothetical protein